jgi:hypothetical protein
MQVVDFQQQLGGAGQTGNYYLHARRFNHVGNPTIQHIHRTMTLFLLVPRRTFFTALPSKSSPTIRLIDDDEEDLWRGPPQKKTRQ